MHHPIRITKRASLSKISNQKKMSVTMTDNFRTKQQKPLFKQQKLLPAKLPPIRRTLKNASTKVIQAEPLRKQTQTTLGESVMMFQSMYGGKQWLKPSDYVKEIGELNLLGEQTNIQVKLYDINLTQKFEKNIEKYGRMRQVTEKWIFVLKKAISYLKSKKASSEKLFQQVKFWKLLSKKFDQLQYEFNDQRTTTLIGIMKKFIKTQPLFKPILQQFMQLKQEVVKVTPYVKKLYLQLQQIVAGFILKFQQSSDIGQAIHLLKKILIGFQAIGEGNQLIKNRYGVLYDKLDQCMTQKLLATSIYPRQLANISSVKENYRIIDQGLSFYSHFINSLESHQGTYSELILKAQYARQVLVNLLQILSYFQYLYNRKQVQQFSKLFSYPLTYNIYQLQNQSEWNSYMELVNNSMEMHHFQV